MTQSFIRQYIQSDVIDTEKLIRNKAFNEGIDKTLQSYAKSIEDRPEAPTGKTYKTTPLDKLHKAGLTDPKAFMKELVKVLHKQSEHSAEIRNTIEQIASGVLLRVLSEQKKDTVKK